MKAPMTEFPYPSPLGYTPPYPLPPFTQPRRITPEAAMEMADKAGVEIERDGRNLWLTAKHDQIPPAVIEALRQTKPHIRWRLRKAEMLVALDEAYRHGVGLYVKDRQLYAIGVAPYEVFERLYEHWDAIAALFSITPELAAIFSPKRIDLRIGFISWRKGHPIN